MILRGIALSDFKIAASRLYSNAMHAPRGRVVLIDGGGEVPEAVTVGVFAVFFV
jgi:hypothetical protein